MGKAAVEPQGGWTGGAGGRVPRVAAVVLAVVLHLALVVFTVASGLVAPPWAVVAFHVLWVAAAAVLVLTSIRRPLFAPLVPVANAVLLWLAVMAGDIWLGWTA